MERGHAGAHLWPIRPGSPDRPADLLEGSGAPNLSGVAWTGSEALLTDFHGGRLWRLRDGDLSIAATGLIAPDQAAVSDKGDVYVAESGSGVVRRVFA